MKASALKNNHAPALCCATQASTSAESHTVTRAESLIAGGKPGLRFAHSQTVARQTPRRFARSYYQVLSPLRELAQGRRHIPWNNSGEPQNEMLPRNKLPAD